ncbi:uncharacterized protein [Macrobrachium rosenbergii]|uniref:uncharacterized protein n=1 Tax=Macrobrachium rosenbergii TaxID=79674 RepID=UPI0034D68DEB
MPYKCCVPKCNGNYVTGPKVHCFSFPKNEEERKKWTIAIHRENFTANEHSKVCELHFKPEDIRKDTSAVDEKTGVTITAKLQRPRLCKGAVPSLLPGCPKYLNVDTCRRESPDSKKQRLEMAAIESAIEKSVTDDNEYQNKIQFKSSSELLGKLKLDKYWKIQEIDESVLISHTTLLPVPKIALSLVVHSDCSVAAYVEGVAVNRWGNYVIPSHVYDTNILELILDRLRMFDKQSSSSLNEMSVLHLVISLLTTVLQDQSYKHINTLKFVSEQLYLLTLEKYEYSTDLLVLSSLLYNFSPRAYRFIRDKRLLILPCCTTIRKVFMSKQFSPEIEQHDDGFLSYIKNKAKSLLPSDKTVILMVDEIHLSSYLDYKGGSIVGSAFNSNEAATSAYAFMLNSIGSKFRFVVHIIPVKTIKAEILHMVLKKVIIGLEKIGFNVLCVVSDNNRINGKECHILQIHQVISRVPPPCTVQ